MAPIPNEPAFIAVVRQWQAALGAEKVLTKLAERTFFSTDVFSQREIACAVLQPGTVDELAAAVKIATSAGLAVVPRGGGFSYTGGYTPSVDDAVLIDLRGLDRIVEINAEDMFVTVECGCTWRTLHEALARLGLRTPYFGPISGYHATVGGALSQGSFFFGSTQHGAAADSVLGLELVLSDGSRLRTGSAATVTRPSPFFRNYGPDLTGLFLGDTGALGFKATATLRLLPRTEHQRFATFATPSPAVAIAIVSEVARQGLASECYAWDPVLVRRMGAQTDLLQNLKYVAGVARSGSSLLGGLRDATRVAVTGKKVFEGDSHLVHVIIDEAFASVADEKHARCCSIAVAQGAAEIEASIPRIMRGTPFIDFNRRDLAATGMRNLPTNGLCPHSRLPALAAAIRKYFAATLEQQRADGIQCGIILFAVGASAVCIEPIFMWKDEHNLIHDRVDQRSREDAVSRSQRAVSEPSPAPLPSAAQRAVAQLRSGLIEIMTAHGCAHVQIGRSYPWLATREPVTRQLLQQLKRAVDPAGRMNPGSLGFGA